MAKKQALPERKIHSIEEFLAKFADVQEVIIDGTDCAENLALIRHVSFNLLSRDKKTKVGVKTKRLKAG